MTEQELTALAQLASGLLRPHYQSKGPIFDLAEGCALLVDDYLTLKAERDAIKARVSLLREALAEFVEWHGGAHSGECPEDDTCECIGKYVNDKANAALRAREVEP